jgi:hypothetical protein
MAHSIIATPYTGPLPEPLPWDHPDSDPVGDVHRILARDIERQKNPILRGALERFRDSLPFIARGDE